MTTGINNWLAMEQPELTVDDIYFGDDADHDPRPRKSGPFAVTVGDDDEVVYFRSPRAASVFGSRSDSTVSVEFVGDQPVDHGDDDGDLWDDYEDDLLYAVA